MRTRSKLLLTALAASALLCVAQQSASASKLEIPNFERGFRLNWRPLKLEAGGNVIAECPVELEGTFERSAYVKRAGTPVGRVTEARLSGACTRGTATVLRETLPWEVTYNSFGGTLPNITSLTLNLIRASFQVEISGITCLARTEGSRPGRGIATVSSGTITGFRAEENAGIETTGGFFCSISGAGHFAGAAERITNRGGTEAITVRLIEAQLSPSPVAFGNVEPSSTTERTVTIRAGRAEITVNSISLTSGTSYSISDPNSCRGARIAGNGSCSFIVTFRAPAELARSASDTINVETSAERLTDTVSGSTPDLVAAPSPVEFGRLATNTLARREVTITSGVETTIESIRLRTGTHFSITDPNRCIGTRIAVNGRCTFNAIVETPAETERTLEDTIQITTGAATIEDRVRAST